MKDNKFIAQPFVPKTETKIVLENQQKPKLSLAARSKVIKMYGSDYLSSRATIINPSYGPGDDNDESLKKQVEENIKRADREGGVVKYYEEEVIRSDSTKCTNKGISY